ncbi:LytR C-terminal domain-containing protein [Azohydromonas caseinilytica]|uniref:Tetratricopeptide repeat protein n=1 Tax=Azohydromonas caseinilytica TaxID=2728836 RepID=A0A848FA28_9BURK|nr:LytR C-terminal domain-containing protein [Azohydromonas caseinilytica]NML15309.1 tetratricopeptide repeat protein [Azohydromonas caseinilytica]
MLTLGGCATKSDRLPWRIEPVQSVTHGLGQGSADSYYVVGRQIERSRDWLRAAEAYRQALQSDPGHIDARNALAVVLARLGLLQEAEAQLRLALQAAPQRADLHSNLGYLLVLARRLPEAQATLHAALALNPQDRVAQANLLLAQGRAPASATPMALAQAGTSAMTAAATTTPAAAVPAAAAPRPGAALQVLDAATLPPLTQAVPGHSPSALSPAAADVPALVSTATTPAASLPSKAAPDVMAAPFTLEVTNGMGRRGAAQQLREQLESRGFDVERTSNLPPYRQARTMVLYRPGHEAAARQVARALPLPVALRPEATQEAHVRVLLGRDWPSALRVAAARMNRE